MDKSNVTRIDGALAGVLAKALVEAYDLNLDISLIELDHDFQEVRVCVHQNGDDIVDVCVPY